LGILTQKNAGHLFFWRRRTMQTLLRGGGRTGQKRSGGSAGGVILLFPRQKGNLGSEMEGGQYPIQVGRGGKRDNVLNAKKPAIC